MNYFCALTHQLKKKSQLNSKLWESGVLYEPAIQELEGFKLIKRNVKQ